MFCATPQFGTSPNPLKCEEKPLEPNLSDAELIASLLIEKPRRPKPRRISLEIRSSYPRKRRSQCRCGRCKRCMENARWERIFNDKFADPDYYRSKPFRFGSTLSWL